MKPARLKGSASPSRPSRGTGTRRTPSKPSPTPTRRPGTSPSRPSRGGLRGARTPSSSRPVETTSPNSTPALALRGTDGSQADPWVVVTPDSADADIAALHAEVLDLTIRLAAFESSKDSIQARMERVEAELLQCIQGIETAADEMARDDPQSDDYEEKIAQLEEEKEQRLDACRVAEEESRQATQEATEKADAVEAVQKELSRVLKQSEIIAEHGLDQMRASMTEQLASEYNHLNDMKAQAASEAEEEEKVEAELFESNARVEDQLKADYNALIIKTNEADALWKDAEEQLTVNRLKVNRGERDVDVALTAVESLASEYTALIEEEEGKANEQLHLAKHQADRDYAHVEAKLAEAQEEMAQDDAVLASELAERASAKKALDEEVDAIKQVFDEAEDARIEAEGKRDAYLKKKDDAAVVCNADLVERFTAVELIGSQLDALLNRHYPQLASNETPRSSGDPPAVPNAVVPTQRDRRRREQLEAEYHRSLGRLMGFTLGWDAASGHYLDGVELPSVMID